MVHRIKRLVGTSGWGFWCVTRLRVSTVFTQSFTIFLRFKRIRVELRFPVPRTPQTIPEWSCIKFFSVPTPSTVYSIRVCWALPGFGYTGVREMTQGNERAETWRSFSYVKLLVSIRLAGQPLIQCSPSISLRHGWRRGVPPRYRLFVGKWIYEVMRRYTGLTLAAR